ncbi:biotin transporter BioY [Brevundimonas sp. A19_0]|uniref:biotin transporter BioY n=1 Tax=Brevundimonas sp. A19_0 TaxID=2821087 RepID=UPI001ADA8483|nr:biotin transporter BioY [Brevundimonas sp. A19_0]MBO9501849.1 biotin transporter BioY [Brevundimonas sp. A19_0]
MILTPFRHALPCALACFGFVLLIALGARVDVAVPGSPVPQSLQTLVVLAAGLALGPRWGLAAAALYVLAGALGLPVFADGASGLSVLAGPTAGYLAGFVLAAGFVGALSDDLARGRRGRQIVTALGLGLVGHVLILAPGWAGLALRLGPAAALSAGVVPFLWGMVVKSAIVALAAPLLLGLRQRLNI